MIERRPVLASGSATRRAMLRRAGVAVDVRVEGIDETAIIDSLREEGVQPDEIARTLAETKAIRAGRHEPDRVTIGCDQLLVCEGRIFVKAASVDAARRTLTSLRGRSHDLISSCVVALGSRSVWHATRRATLTMRAFSDDFLDAYLARNWPAVGSSVGCYLVEEEGIQLFSGIDGDHATILGLPLLDLLGYLRARGLLPR